MIIVCSFRDTSINAIPYLRVTSEPAYPLPVVLERISPMSNWHPLNRNNRMCAKVVRPKLVIAPEKFGRLLREWRKRRGLNQLEAAAELGVWRDQAKISKWEKGRQMPRKPVLLALLARLKEGGQ